MAARDPGAVGAAGAQPRRREPRLRGRLGARRRPGRRARAVRGGRGGAAGGGAARRAARGLAREPVSRPARPLRRARAASPGAGARWRASCPTDALLVANGDDPQLGELATERAEVRVVFGLDDPRHASPELQHAADSKWCVRCGTPYEYAAAYIGHLGDYRCPACGHARPPLDVVAREIELNGLESVSFELVTPEGSRACRAARCPGSTTSTTRSPRPRWLARSGASRDEIVAGLQGFSAAFGRFERIAARRPLAARAADQEPGRRERGRAHARRRRRAAACCSIALNDEIADGRDVSWIWDVDFEPLLDGLERLDRDRRARGRARAALQVRGLAGARDRGRARRSRHALDRGARADPAGGELVALPTYTAMLALRDLVARARLRRSPTGRRRREDRRRPPLPGLPEHLRRPRQHRRAGAARRLARARARGAAARRRRRGAAGRARPLLRRRRPGPRAGAGRARARGARAGAARGGRARRRCARGLRRLPAPRALLPRPERRRAAGRRPAAAAHGRRRARG